MEIEKLKQEYFRALDYESLKIAEDIVNKKPITNSILNMLKKMYAASNTEKNLFNNEGLFECAYHPPVTSDFEFFISRILYNYSKINGLNWKVCLRRQSKNKGKLLAPDIRIESNGKTLLVIEIKVKVGWIQYLFSKERSEKDKSRGFAVDKKVMEEKNRINFLIEGFNGLSKEHIFYLIPSLKEVYRKKYNKGLEDYKNYFAESLNLKASQIIVLSNNSLLNLDRFDQVKEQDYQPTDELEKMFVTLGVRR